TPPSGVRSGDRPAPLSRRATTFANPGAVETDPLRVRRRSLAVLTVALLATACSPPITVRRVDPQRAYRVTSENEITAGVLSRYTLNLLFDHDLIEQYEK